MGLEVLSGEQYKNDNIYTGSRTFKNISNLQKSHHYTPHIVTPGLDSPEKAKKGPRARTWADVARSPNLKREAKLSKMMSPNLEVLSGELSKNDNIYTGSRTFKKFSNLQKFLQYTLHNVTPGLNIKIHKTANPEERLEIGNLSKLGDYEMHMKQLDSSEKAKKGPMARTWADVARSPNLKREAKVSKMMSPNRGKLESKAKRLYTLSGQIEVMPSFKPGQNPQLALIMDSQGCQNLILTEDYIAKVVSVLAPILKPLKSSESLTSR